MVDIGSHSSPSQASRSIGSGRGRSVPEAELPVARGIGVPVGQGLDEVAQPRALADEGGQRWGRHGRLLRKGGCCLVVEVEVEVVPVWKRGESFKPEREREDQIGARAIRQR